MSCKQTLSLACALPVPQLCPEHPRAPSPRFDEDEGLSIIMEGGRRSTSSYMTDDSAELSALLQVKTLELRSPTSRSLSSAGGRRSPLIQEPKLPPPRKSLTQPPAPDPSQVDPPAISPAVTIVPVAMFHQYEGDDATEAGSVTDRGTDGERTEATNEREEEGEEEEEEGLGQLIQEHSTVSLVSNSKSTATQGKQATAQPSWC